SVTNALSDYLQLSISRDGKLHRQEYHLGVPVAPLAVAGETRDRGTVIRFKPSSQIFTNIQFNYDILAKRLRELSFLNSGVRIELIDERENRSDVFAHAGGLQAFVKYMNRTRTPVHESVFWFRTQDGATSVEVAFRRKSRAWWRTPSARSCRNFCSSSRRRRASSSPRWSRRRARARRRARRAK